MLSRMGVDTTYGRAAFNIVVMGFGLGTALPLYVIAVQNAVPYRVMGVATSSIQFFRAIGGTLGLAIFGSLMASRFASDLETLVPPAVAEALPPDALAEIASNPQALVDPGAVSGLEGLFAGLGLEGAEMAQQLMTALKQALAMAISDVFLLGLAAVAAGLVATMFLREIPLKRSYRAEEVREESRPNLLAREPGAVMASPGAVDCCEQEQSHSQGNSDNTPEC